MRKCGVQRVTSCFDCQDISQCKFLLVVSGICQSALQTQGLVLGILFDADGKCTNAFDDRGIGAGGTGGGNSECEPKARDG